MSNAASLFPAPPARPALTAVEHPTAAPEGPAFSDLLDVGAEPSAPRDPAVSARASEARDGKRTEPPRRRDGGPDRPERRTDEPDDSAGVARREARSEAPASEAKSASPNSDDTSDSPAKATEASDREGDAGQPDETPAQVVVTPVAISLIAEQAVNEADPAAPGATEAISASSGSDGSATKATLSLIAPETAAGPSAAQTTEAEKTIADARLVIAASAQPGRSQHLKQTEAQQGEQNTDASGGDDAPTADSLDTEAAPADRAELLKALHAGHEGKAHRSEHSADGEVKAGVAVASDTLSAPPPSNNGSAPQAPAQGGLAPATAAAGGVFTSGAQGASEHGSDAGIPIEGLAVEIVSRVREGKNRFEIRLDPPELGRIDVRLDIDRQGNVTSRLLVERADTLDLLRRDFSGLERALNDAGLKTDSGSLQFSMRDQGFAGGSQQHREPAPNARVIVPVEPDTVSAGARYNLARRGGLDIRV